MDGVQIPVAGMIGDQQAALFGQLCLEKGSIKNTYGTGCFLLMNTGEKAVESSNRLLTTVAWKIGDKVNYALEGSVFVAGAAVQWLRDNLRIIKSSSEIEVLASQVPNSGGVWFVPALTGLGAPYWDSEARGCITGLSRGTTAAHIARAALDGIACSVADVVRCMQRDSRIPLTHLKVDGGASANNLLMQIQADVLGFSVLRPQERETTALGACYMATDYATSPMTPKGQIIYGIAIGALTIIIRNWGSYPEGMSFAILIMNAFTPLINNYCKPRRFGEKVRKEASK